MTSSKRRSARLSTETVKAVRACSTAFVHNSLATKHIGDSKSARPCSRRDRDTKWRAEPMSEGWPAHAILSTHGPDTVTSHDWGRIRCRHILANHAQLSMD